MCLVDKLGLPPEVLVRICAVEGEEREACFGVGLEEEDFEDSVVVRRLDLRGRVEEVDVRGVEVDEASEYPESCLDILIAWSFGEDMGLGDVGESCWVLGILGVWERRWSSMCEFEGSSCAE